MKITAYQLASRYIGVKEVKGQIDNPIIIAMLRLDQKWPEHDEVPWCSAFVNWIAWQLRLPRSKSLMARSWLEIGEVIEHYSDAKVGWDVVILSRGKNPELGHVGFFAGYDGSDVYVLGGNQNNEVSQELYKQNRIIGIRRLYNEDMC